MHRVERPRESGDVRPRESGDEVKRDRSTSLTVVHGRPDEDEIARVEQGRRYNIEVAKYMEELRDSAYIFTDPPPEAAGFRNLLGAGSVDRPGLESAAQALTELPPSDTTIEQ